MNIRFKWIGGATWILKTGAITIACDPVLCGKGTVQDYKYFKTVRLDDPVFDRDDFTGIDLWLLTHGHDDHLDGKGLEKISAGPVIIAHRSAKDKLDRAGLKDLTILRWGETREMRLKNTDIAVRAVPAIHAKSPFLGKYIGNNNGYSISIRHGGEALSLYVTGDDVFSPKRFSELAGAPVDLVVANAGGARVGTGLMGRIIGRITSNSGDLARMASLMDTGMIIPVHRGTFTHYTDTAVPFDTSGRIRNVAQGEWTGLRTGH